MLETTAQISFIVTYIRDNDNNVINSNYINKNNNWTRLRLNGKVNISDFIILLFTNNIIQSTTF